MDRFDQIYKQIIFEANYNFGSDFIKKGQYNNIAIYFSQQHIINRIEERDKTKHLGDILKSNKKFLKLLDKNNKLLKEKQLQKHYNVFDSSRNLFYGCDLVKKQNNLFLKVNTFLNPMWRETTYKGKIYEI